LLGRVREIDAVGGPDAGDDHIRRWLLAFHLGQDSVHRLRHAVGPWVEKDVLGDLAGGDDVVAASVARAATAPAAPTSPQSDDLQLDGLDLLGEEPVPDPSVNSIGVQRLLDLAVEAKRAGDGEVSLPSGERLPATDVRERLHGSVTRPRCGEAASGGWEPA
jgi:hypothetical protein